MHYRWPRLLMVTSTLVLTLLALGALPTRAHTQTHVVRPHDTLSGIAVAYGTAVSSLMAANNLSSPDSIAAGQTLRVGTGYGRDGDHPRWRHGHPDTDSTRAGGAQPTPGASTSGYVVRPGDTLSGIALRFGVRQADLAAANSGTVLSPLRAGLWLRIPTHGAIAEPTQVTAPAGAPVATPAAPAAPAVVVQGGTIGDLLTAQAQAAGVSPALVKAVAWQESGWRMVIAGDGGIGVMQLMPATVDWISTALLGYRLNPYSAAENIHGGVALLRYYLGVFGGNQQLAIAAYHQGLASVQRQGISAGTARYVANVLALEQRFA